MAGQRRSDAREGEMFWQSVEELETQKEMRRVESKEKQMLRKGMQALKNIEDAKEQNDTRTKRKCVAQEIEQKGQTRARVEQVRGGRGLGREVGAGVLGERLREPRGSELGGGGLGGVAQ